MVPDIKNIKVLYQYINYSPIYQENKNTIDMPTIYRGSNIQALT